MKALIKAMSRPSVDYALLLLAVFAAVTVFSMFLNDMIPGVLADVGRMMLGLSRK